MLELLIAKFLNKLYADRYAYILRKEGWCVTVYITKENYASVFIVEAIPTPRVNRLKRYTQPKYWRK